jgi:hypothetical protein
MIDENVFGLQVSCTSPDLPTYNKDRKLITKVTTAQALALKR